jgi:hypothetical protein
LEKNHIFWIPYLRNTFEIFICMWVFNFNFFEIQKLWFLRIRSTGAYVSKILFVSIMASLSSVTDWWFFTRIAAEPIMSVLSPSENKEKEPRQTMAQNRVGHRGARRALGVPFTKELVSDNMVLHFSRGSLIINPFYNSCCGFSLNLNWSHGKNYRTEGEACMMFVLFP